MPNLNTYDEVAEMLKRQPKVWLVTGVAGFIGSNLLEALLKLNQKVIGLDNYSTGSRHNLERVASTVDIKQWKNFMRIDGDIQELAVCKKACQGVDVVLHQAALGSVPRSMADPITTNSSNVTGFLSILVAARDQGIKRFVYASSSSVYGDDPGLPKVEERLGRCLSPYAVTKLANELYADVFARTFGMETIGLRYFNVFGPRQDPEGPYAAVIPKWVAAMIKNEPVYINGDGETSRDFCYVENVVQANVLAATTRNPDALNQVYSVALGERTTLNQLFSLLRDRLVRYYRHLERYEPVYRDFRPGDVRHSEADITKAKRHLGYAPSHRVAEGLDAALDWYRRSLA
jgi:UDP-N-acetylglucosamine 4-epimerase